MKKNTILIVVGLIIFVGGFLTGQEYNKAQLRKKFLELDNQIKTGFTAKSGTNIIQEQKDKESELKKKQIIEKQVGNEIELATIKFQVNTSNEEKIIQQSYGTPIVADEGTKFLFIQATVTNTTKAPFYFSSSDLQLMDDKGTMYNPYDKYYSVDNKIEQEISPNIPKEGVMVYQIPNNIDKYSLLIGKAGTNIFYKIKIKWTSVVLTYQ